MLDLDVMIDEETIQKRIGEMAEEIDKCYHGESIIAICVLRGAIYFTVDLTKKMKTPIETDFIRVSSYVGTESTGNIIMKLDISENIENRDVLIIEDIIDTGYTLKYLRDYLLTKNPKSLRIAVLADKEERRKVEVPIDFVGFKIPDKFIVGYGFDYDNSYRNLPYIGSMKE
ncbi:MAG: hypoxanthine phosphoribosyltransferase [Clostridia bacterium]|nr:hypoxanthine phosphoribosyltransferase [Clostridia bacterium]